MIVTEGEVSEPQYFEFVRTQLNSFGVSVKCVPGKVDPQRLVQKAVELRDKEVSAFGESGGYDATWVAVDVDRHAKLPAAMELAQRQGVSMAISNPCFEIWLLLHLVDHSAFAETKDIVTKWRMKSGATDKSIDWTKLVGQFEIAEKRSQGNRVMHERDGKSHPDDNPSSNIDELVRLLLDGARASSNNTELSL
ncbi:RloB family protein [Paenarthrobacter nitroguajacolicus]|uniref:RloB family protein n=1 Tax=Paenarthrobacter nitroguajacolicus TaxID=211146 RepID=UPI00285BE291|nr:RloB family protein [Paenarthrobacter nitroguajacolicus]MDR6639011.1 hypothetical protein [Paenarthrobacter nitroguajacolicus]